MLLSYINDNGDNDKTKSKKFKKLGREYLKTWVGIFQVGIFRGEFTRGEFDWLEFSGREFSWYRFSQVIDTNSFGIEKSG